MISHNSMLKLIRLEKRITTSEMAKDLGISVSYLSRLEDGTRTVSKRIVKDLQLDNPNTISWFYCLSSTLGLPSPIVLTSRDYKNAFKTLLNILNIEWGKKDGKRRK